jgi:hypothetical protein
VVRVHQVRNHWVRVSLGGPSKHRKINLYFLKRQEISSASDKILNSQKGILYYTIFSATCWTARLTWNRKGDRRIRRKRMRQWPALKRYPRNSQKSPGKPRKIESGWLASILRIGLRSSPTLLTIHTTTTTIITYVMVAFDWLNWRNFVIFNVKLIIKDHTQLRTKSRKELSSSLSVKC